MKISNIHKTCSRKCKNESDRSCIGGLISFPGGCPVLSKHCRISLHAGCYFLCANFAKKESQAIKHQPHLPVVGMRGGGQGG